MCVGVTFSGKVNPASNPAAQQALLPKALQCQQALPKPSQMHTHTHTHIYTHAHTSSDAFLVNQPQGPVLCPKILIPSRKQAPPKTPNNGSTKLSYNYKPPLSAKEPGRLEVQSSYSSK